MFTGKIIVIQRSEDFQAYIEGNKAVWGCGETQAEAIGDLVISHSTIIGLEIELPEQETENYFCPVCKTRSALPDGCDNLKCEER